jgi:hypothetical protein
MNYIKHLNTVFQQFSKDSRLLPTHISLYMALFQFWNIGRFPDRFHLDREDTMQLSKLGSKVTYHRCLRNLNDWGYIRYLPSHNPYKGSQIEMLKFCTSTGTSGGQAMERPQGQAVVPYTNNNKPNGNKFKRAVPESETAVMDHFKKKDWPLMEAKKFYNHYSSIDWKLGGRARITNWHSTAENWMVKAMELRKQPLGRERSPQPDNLKITKIKDYGQPL